ncbi:TDP-N-acetylfucosamine:lipid II N-acetylfucosaminyltransferase [Pseudoalteromonas tunicata]|uniref:TDP-N-acetylfucosamine:lipid II N-acetylfucosaminyltransferase n=1 Tax=Pseudoalteromonas tunicata TaxID=314281 RepID=UPI00273FD567|nr:TDP-N-acetylfucosamine:lipid II N-acetylfucosaminyltransferase [Pseudoalteromonas tunicata]MDP5213584.1 TDP-N-acetylfucosamine:lipid II N-acetylfucosaminyltransferase [Pseudoalteromonas tunicata]
MNKKHILHLITKLPEKYNSKFVSFSEEHLTEYSHTYVTLVSDVGLKSNNGLADANIIDLNLFGRVAKMKRLISLFLNPQYDLVIFHGLFYKGPFLFFLSCIFKFTSLPEKSLWMTWGGDIYYFQNRVNNITGWFNELLRKSMIKKFFFISSLLPDEVELIRLNYHARAIHLDAFYPNPAPYEDYSVKLSEKDGENKFSFLLGNSADPQNNHDYMLRALSHLKGDIKIFCILSYSIVDKEYVRNIIALGHELFDEDFIPLTDFMSIDDYKMFIETIDFACYYHNRQQAMGNIFQFLHMGKSVFLRQDTLSKLFLHRYGFQIQCSENLADLNTKKLVELKQIDVMNKVNNQKVIESHFSELAAKAKWSLALEKVFAFIKKSN